MAVPRDDGSPEAGLSFEAAMNQLTEQERLVCVWLQLGFTPREVASGCGLSVAEIETVHRDALEKIRELMGTLN